MPLRSLIAAMFAALVIPIAATAAPSPSDQAARPFHGGGCQQVASNFKICFEAWGVHKALPSGGSIDLAQRRFTEYTNEVLTFEQRDLSHHIVSGQGRVEIDLFAGMSTPSGLTCRWRDHLVAVDGDVVYSVDDLTCVTRS
jgi:hypothetical protein